MGTTAEKLTYLNTTKGKIKDGINNLGGNITSETTFREYVTELNNIYETLPKVNGSGTSLSLTPTLKGKITSTLKGNTSQTGTPTPSSPIPINNVSGDNTIKICGKNIVNWNNINWYRNNNNDYTYISDNSTIRVKSSLIEVSGGTYTISGIPSVLTMNNSSPYCYDSNKTYLGDRYATFTNNTITIPSNVKYIALVLNGTDLTDAIKTTLSNSNMQLEVGNQATTYEAYNGTTYNIDLPVENLFDKDNANIGAFYIYNNKILASTVDKMIILGIKPNTTYTIQKGLNATQTANRFKVGTCVDSPANNVELTNYVGYGDGTQVQEITITSGANDKYLVVQIANNQANYDEIKGTIQIEYGSKKNTYTPYGTTPIELNKIGTYQDYIYKENDKWYKKPMVLKIASYNGETITTDFISTTGELTTGATIYYKNPTENPSGIEITYTPLIEQLNTMEQAQSKQGTTNINQVNNDLGFIINASALKGSEA